MHTVTIATFNESKPAELLRDWLEAAGVPTLVRDQRLLQKLWFFARPYSSFHLDVEKDHFVKANALISDWQQEKHALSEALCCPKCGSLRLEYPHMTRKFMLPTIVAHVLSAVGIAKHQFYCNECQHTWRWPTKAGGKPVNAPH